MRYVAAALWGSTIWDFARFAHGIPGDVEDFSKWYDLVDARLILYVAVLVPSTILFSVEWWWPRLLQLVRRRRRIYIHRTVGEIFTELNGHTDMRNELATERYIGKWIEAEQEIYDIMPQPNGKIIVGAKGAGDDGFTFFFLDAGRWKGDVEMLVQGDLIRAEGWVSVLNKHWMFLFDCHKRGGPFLVLTNTYLLSLLPALDSYPRCGRASPEPAQECIRLRTRKERIRVIVASQTYPDHVGVWC